MLRLLIVTAFAALLSGCCIPFPAKYVVTPAVNGSVTAGSKPVPQATVALARFEFHPHFRPETERRTDVTTSDDGRFAFALLREREWVMPLMMHGVPGFGWQICAEADGYETSLQALRWNEEPSIDVHFVLKPGTRRPCSEFLGISRNSADTTSVVDG